MPDQMSAGIGTGPAGMSGVFVQAGPLKAHQLHRRGLAQAVAALHMEELEQEAVAGVGGHEGAAALAAHHDVVGHQVVHGAAYGADGYPQALCQRRLTRQRAPGRHLAHLHHLQQLAFDGPEQRHAGGIGLDQAQGGGAVRWVRHALAFWPRALQQI